METKELKAAILNPAAAPLDRDRKARLLKIRQETDLGSDAFRAVVTSVIEREVDKMTELTCGEADQVIAHFNREAACEHPPTA